MPNRVYLFDFDGTLVDSMPTYAASVLAILDENGVSYGEDLIEIVTPLGTLETARYLIGIGLKMQVEEVLSRMKEKMLDAYCQQIPAKEFVKEALVELKTAGCSLNVLTASPHLTLDPCLKRLGLYELFDNVWSCDDFGTSKADPEIYRMAARRLGVSVEDVLFLDDNIGALKTAKTAGMKTCGIFDESSRDASAEIKREADHYLEDFRPLPRLKW